MAFSKELKDKLEADRKRALKNPSADSAKKFTNEGILVEDKATGITMDTGDAKVRLDDASKPTGAE